MPITSLNWHACHSEALLQSTRSCSRLDWHMPVISRHFNKFNCSPAGFRIRSVSTLSFKSLWTCSAPCLWPELMSGVLSLSSPPHQAVPQDFHQGRLLLNRLQQHLHQQLQQLPQRHRLQAVLFAISPHLKWLNAVDKAYATIVTNLMCEVTNAHVSSIWK